jgi:hypothetical protein
MAQTERAKCYYITIPGMIQGKISAERGKIAQNQPIRGMISADGGAAVGFREISLPLFIGLDGMRAGRFVLSVFLPCEAACNLV